MGLSWGQCHSAQLHLTWSAFALGQRQNPCARAECHHHTQLERGCCSPPSNAMPSSGPLPKAFSKTGPWQQGTSGIGLMDWPQLRLKSLNLDVDAFGPSQESNGVCKSTAQDLDALICPQFYFRSMPFAFDTPVLFWTAIINFSKWIMALCSHDGGQKY